jgi:hypothetical protein
LSKQSKYEAKIRRITVLIATLTRLAAGHSVLPHRSDHLECECFQCALRIEPSSRWYRDSAWSATSSASYQVWSRTSRLPCWIPMSTEWTCWEEWRIGSPKEFFYMSARCSGNR